MDRTRKSLRYDTRTPHRSRWRRLDPGLSSQERIAPRSANGSGGRHFSAQGAHCHGDRAKHSDAYQPGAVEPGTLDRYTDLAESDDIDSNHADLAYSDFRDLAESGLSGFRHYPGSHRLTRCLPGSRALTPACPYLFDSSD
jgi:hypothetical protein